ncbi:MAG: tetratricopeptide repeat protein [Pseudacidovorax sp.]|nr:tetratricopeptide repeat protein [Pseudacidovorax sp.]
MGRPSSSASHQSGNGRGFAAWNVGFGHECAGHLPQAALRYEEVIASQRDNSLVVRMIGCQSLAGVLERQSRAAEAMPLFDEALQLCRQVGLLRLGDVHGSLARLLADCARVRVAADSEPDPARALAQEALVTAQALQDSAAAPSPPTCWRSAPAPPTSACA